MRQGLLLALLLSIAAAASPARAQWRHFGHHHHHHGGRYFGGGYYMNRIGGLYGGYWPGYFRGGGLSISLGYPYGYSWSNYQGGLYGAYYSPRANYVEYYLPPTFYPAELNFGPQAMNQFLGLPRDLGVQPLLDAAPRIAAKIPVDEHPIKPAIQEFNFEARQKADKYIEQGDSYFQKQKFYDALLRYKMAAAADASYPEAQLRHGFSLVANRRYDEAAAAFKRAFALDKNIVKSGFHVDLLYADNIAAKGTHEEALAQAALNEPENGELYWTLGIWLIFNGEPNRSARFFEKAKQLGVKPVSG